MLRDVLPVREPTQEDKTAAIEQENAKKVPSIWV